MTKVPSPSDHAPGLAGLPGHVLRRMIDARTISIPELVQASLDAIAAADPSLHAFVTLCPDQAMAEAHLAQKRVGTGGAPLLGLPLAVKDAEPVAGLRFTSGSLVHSDRIAVEDSAHVARLRAAGAIVIGKTNTPEFTLLGETRNRLGPDTCNPWNPQMTSGGSSGGSAAALASGMVPLATGSDTAGSITIPAAFCGVVGFKPSHRRIPVWPLPQDWAPYSDVGPMTRSIADAALMLAAASGPDPRDPFSAPAFDACSTPPRLLRRLRIAWVPTLAGLPVDPVCSATVADVANALASLGHTVQAHGPNVDNPGPALDILGAVQEYRIRGSLLESSASLLGPETREILASGQSARQQDIDAAQAVTARVAAAFRAFLADYDILLTPATACLAFPLRHPPALIAGRPVVPDWPSYAPFNMFANISGCPVGTIPWRLSDSGLPVGVLAFAGYGRDALLLAALSEAEHLRGPFALAPPRRR
jgi:aspartyl-tRNA(Asn)/glutamyl-tRNA(Gln) amidotransferase subunit A